MSNYSFLMNITPKKCHKYISGVLTAVVLVVFFAVTLFFSFTASLFISMLAFMYLPALLPLTVQALLISIPIGGLFTFGTLIGTEQLLKVTARCAWNKIRDRGLRAVTLKEDILITIGRLEAFRQEKNSCNTALERETVFNNEKFFVENSLNELSLRFREFQGNGCIDSLIYRGFINKLHAIYH